jgi:predicted DNA-binding transcriptional regulator YafY
VSAALDDRSLWDTMQEQADGSLIVTLNVPSLEWAARMALGYSPRVLVLEPEELRHMVNERARATVSLYA